MKRSKELRVLVLSAILIAANVVLKRVLGINAVYFQTSVGFVPIAIGSALFGYASGVNIAFFADLIGTLLLDPFPYNPLFAINEILYALIYAAFFYKKDECDISNVTRRTVLCTIIQAVFVAIPLTPTWLYIYWSFFMGEVHVFSEIFMTKLTVSLVEIPIKIVVLIPIMMYVVPKAKQFLKLKD